MKKADIVKKVCEILDVKYSHYDLIWSDEDYFSNMELESPVRIVCYPGMSPWSFAILEDMDVITPTSRFSTLTLEIYKSLKDMEDDSGLEEKYKEMAIDIKEELKRLKLAKEFLIENNCDKIINWDQPNPDGGATSAELGIALGMSTDEALDFHNGINKIVNDE